MDSTVEELRSRCRACSNLTPLSKLTWLLNDNDERLGKEHRVCPDCVMSFECEHCNEARGSTRTVTVSDENGILSSDRVCTSCIEENFLRCNECNVYYDDYLEECPRCSRVNNRLTKERLYRDANITKGLKEAKINNKSGSVIKSPRTFGVEFEIIPKSGNFRDAELKLLKDNTHTDWGITNDDSVRHGIEINTCPLSMNSGEVELKKFTDTISTMFTTDNACGTHVHIDGSDIIESYVKLKRSILSFIVFDDIFLAMLPETRRRNRYCSPLSYGKAVNNRNGSFKKGMSIEEFISVQTRNGIEHTFYKTKSRDAINREKRNHYTEPRYHGINFHSLFSGHGTIENRYLEGTIDYDTIIKWTAINQFIIDNCRTINNKTAQKLMDIKDINDRLAEYAKITGMSNELLGFCKERINKFK